MPRYDVTIYSGDTVAVNDYASLPFFRPWPYAAVVSFLLGRNAAVATHRSFQPVAVPHEDAAQLAAVVSDAMVGAMRGSPPPEIDVFRARTFVVDVDAAHAKCPRSDPSVRLCAHCAARVKRAIGAIHSLVEGMEWGRMIWFNSSSRGAHGYIVHPATARIPHHLRANFARTLAVLVGATDEVDHKASAHWLRAPGTLVEKGVLAPIVDPLHFCPLTTPRIQASDEAAIRASVDYANSQIALARSDCARREEDAAAESRMADSAMGTRKRVYASIH